MNDETAPTPAPAEAPPAGRGAASARLDSVRGRLGAEPDGALARELGIARKTVVEYRKRHGIVAYGAPPTAEPRTPQAPVPARRPSRLDQYEAIIGVLPDRAVAERAGVTPENVRMFRQRRGIPARWRDESTPAATTPKRRGRHPSPPGESRVERALAPFLDDVGTLPDAEVAAKAGVSRSAVSAYRARHRIRAGGPRPTRREDPRPPAPVASARASTTGVWRVVAARDGKRHAFGVFATDAVDAARRAFAALTQKDGRWVIRSLRLVGRPLPE